MMSTPRDPEPPVIESGEESTTKIITRKFDPKKETSRVDLRSISLKKAHLESDAKIKTHYKAAVNYLVSPKGQMLSDNIIVSGDNSFYDTSSIGKTLDDDKVASSFKKLNIIESTLSIQQQRRSNGFLESCLSPRGSHFSKGGLGSK